MRYYTLPHTNMTVSTVCYGAAVFGTDVQGEAMDRLYGLFRAAGGNFFDTAHCYCFWIESGEGASERALGECIRRHGDRDRVVIGTKGGHPGWGDLYPRPDHFLAPEVIARDIDDSLQRLGIEAIDLYWLHRDDPRRPAGEVIETLNAEIARGRLRAIGASNWSTARIAEANAYAVAHGLQGFSASQPQWSLAQSNQPQTDDPPRSITIDDLLATRWLTPGDLAWHRETALPVVPFTPTAGGYFATGGQAEGFDNDISRARLARAQMLATVLGCTPNQIALAYLVNHPFPVSPILGTTKPAHLADALAAFDITLTPEQVRWLLNGEAECTVRLQGVEPAAGVTGEVALMSVHQSPATETPG
jgi:aryl-alcohol dehydrogenase-like predicted oxidoreductase